MRTSWIGVVAAGLLSLAAGTAVPVRADVDVQIHIGVPPPVVVVGPPEMLFLQPPGVYVAVGIPFDLFFVGGRYYYFHDGGWFWGPGYGGPWVHVRFEHLPPGLRKHKIHQLRDYREHEYREFKSRGSNYKGRHFMGESGPGPGKDKKDKGRDSRKEGKGRERGRD